MIKNLKMALIFGLIFSIFISCTKDIESVLPDEPIIEVPLPDEETNAPGEDGNKPGEDGSKPGEDGNKPGEDGSKPGEDGSKPGEDGGTTTPPDNGNANPGNALEVGTGSGNLTIDGNDAKIKASKLIIIKAGTYGSISVKNISGVQNNPVLIKNNGQVTIKEALYTENINDVTISGDNTPGIQYGFNLHNIPYRAVVMNGKMNGVTLKSMSFQNVKDYVIIGGNSNLSYNGSADTRTERFKILNSKFDNVGGIQFGGNLGSNEDRGFVKDVEIAHNIFENSSWGVLVNFSNVQDYNVHHNVLNNVNTSNNEHNGVFLMIGNGKFHNNKFTNYQGNAIRAWVYSRGSTPATVEIYNNLIYNTRKYGAFELQGFDRYIVPGKSTHVNAKVYNNTVGKMNTSKDWEGVVLDLLNYGGTLEYYNNLGFELFHSKPISDMINNYSDVKIIKNTNNMYFKTAAEAVSNTTSLSSKHAGVGATL